MIFSMNIHGRPILQQNTCRKCVMNNVLQRQGKLVTVFKGLPECKAKRVMGKMAMVAVHISHREPFDFQTDQNGQNGSEDLRDFIWHQDYRPNLKKSR